LHNKEGSTLTVGGNFTVNNGEFKNECKTIISGNFVNSKKVEFKKASHTSIIGSFTSNLTTDIKIEQGSIFRSASITSGGNIKGKHGYSVIESASITFWSSSKKFKGELDICSISYAVNEITRLHDSQNNTTLFIFNNLKSIYTDDTGAIINTVQIDYLDIPVISGTVTNINEAYDEFIV
jgi:hypothetical protein